MDRFTHAYEKLREVISQQVFETDWQKFLNAEANVKGLLGQDGPLPADATGLDKLRGRIEKEEKSQRAASMLEACRPGTIALAGAAAHAAWASLPLAGAASRAASFIGQDGADVGTGVVANAAKAGIGSVADRAAALKMLSHLYRANKRGGQDVWVYAPPKAYLTWIFDEIAGSDEQIRTKLDKSDEVYTSSDRDVMCAALAQAMKWSLDAVSKLASPTAATKDMVRRWFADQNTTDAQVGAATIRLKDGFKKIAAVCNSTTLIFSDDPIDRNRVYNKATGKVGWDDWAFVKPSERMDILYIQNAFLKSGATGRIWKCALTIVHEVSHRAVGNDDKMYDFSGLKPNATTLPHATALANADSWAYFATDLAGMLAASDRTTVLKVAA